MGTNQIEDLKNLIYEVNCLGCGKVAFNIPFIINTYHTLTCKVCGEVNIFHILENGGIAFATATQRDVALEKVLKSAEKKMEKMKHYSSLYFDSSVFYKVEGLVIKFDSHYSDFLTQKEVEKFNGLLPIERNNTKNLES